MKITSGEFKYRNIEVPRGIRPTTEKVREAVFSMIRDWIPGACVCDLFAGSGAMGLEALSRGAEKCWFSELSRQNYRVLIANIENCRAQDRCTALNSDYRAAIAKINDRLDIVIVDPPYENTDYYPDELRNTFTIINYRKDTGGWSASRKKSTDPSELMSTVLNSSVSTSFFLLRNN